MADLGLPDLSLFAPDASPGIDLPDLQTFAPDAEPRGENLLSNSGRWLVEDGDTIVDKRSGEIFRLSGMDTPETVHEDKGWNRAELGGAEATRRTLAFVNQTEDPTTGDLPLQTRGTDVYKRTLASIPGHTEAMLGEGFAVPDNRAVDPTQDAARIRRMLASGPLPGHEGATPAQYAAAVDDVRRAAAEANAPHTINTGGILRRSTQRGLDQLGELGGSFAQALGQLIGLEPLEKFGGDIADRNEARISANPSEVPSWEDVHTPGDAATFFVERMGEQLPNVAMAATGSGIGGIVARRAIAGGLEGLAAKEAAKRVAMASRVGRIGGAGATFYPQGVGDIQSELDAAGIRAPGTAFLWGIPYAGAEALSFEVMLGRFFGASTKPIAKNLVESIAKEAGKAIGLSASTGATVEYLQELMVLTAHAMEDPTFEIFSEQNLRRLKESAIVGGMVEGAFGGLGGAAHGLNYEHPGAGPQREGAKVDAAMRKLAQRPAGQLYTPMPSIDGFDPAQYPVGTLELGGTTGGTMPANFNTPLATVREAPTGEVKGTPYSPEEIRAAAEKAESMRETAQSGEAPRDYVHEYISALTVAQSDKPVEALEKIIEGKYERAKKFRPMDSNLADLIVEEARSIERLLGQRGVAKYQQGGSGYNLGIGMRSARLSAIGSELAQDGTVPEPAQDIAAAMQAVVEGRKPAAYDAGDGKGKTAPAPAGLVKVLIPKAQGGGAYYIPAGKGLKARRAELRAKHAAGDQAGILGYAQNKRELRDPDNAPVVSAVDAQGRHVSDQAVDPDMVNAAIDAAREQAGEDGSVQVGSAEDVLNRRAGVESGKIPYTAEQRAAAWEELKALRRKLNVAEAAAAAEGHGLSVKDREIVHDIVRLQMVAHSAKPIEQLKEWVANKVQKANAYMTYAKNNAWGSEEASKSASMRELANLIMAEARGFARVIKARTGEVVPTEWAKDPEPKQLTDQEKRAAYHSQAIAHLNDLIGQNSDQNWLRRRGADFSQEAVAKRAQQVEEWKADKARHEQALRDTGLTPVHRDGKTVYMTEQALRDSGLTPVRRNGKTVYMTEQEMQRAFRDMDRNRDRVFEHTDPSPGQRGVADQTLVDRYGSHVEDRDMDSAADDYLSAGKPAEEPGQRGAAVAQPSGVTNEGQGQEEGRGRQEALLTDGGTRPTVAGTAPVVPGKWRQSDSAKQSPSAWGALGESLLARFAQLKGLPFSKVLQALTSLEKDALARVFPDTKNLLQRLSLLKQLYDARLETQARGDQADAIDEFGDGMEAQTPGEPVVVTLQEKRGSGTEGPHTVDGARQVVTALRALFPPTKVYDPNDKNDVVIGEIEQLTIEEDGDKDFKLTFMPHDVAQARAAMGLDASIGGGALSDASVVEKAFNALVEMLVSGRNTRKKRLEFRARDDSHTLRVNIHGMIEFGRQLLGYHRPDSEGQSNYFRNALSAAVSFLNDTYDVSKLDTLLDDDTEVYTAYGRTYKWKEIKLRSRGSEQLFDVEKTDAERALSVARTKMSAYETVRGRMRELLRKGGVAAKTVLALDPETGKTYLSTSPGISVETLQQVLRKLDRILEKAVKIVEAAEQAAKEARKEARKPVLTRAALQLAINRGEALIEKQLTIAKYGTEEERAKATEKIKALKAQIGATEAKLEALGKEDSTGAFQQKRWSEQEFRSEDAFDEEEIFSNLERLAESPANMTAGQQVSLAILEMQQSVLRKFADRIAAQLKTIDQSLRDSQGIVGPDGQLVDSPRVGEMKALRKERVSQLQTLHRIVQQQVPVLVGFRRERSAWQNMQQGELQLATTKVLDADVTSDEAVGGNEELLDDPEAEAEDFGKSKVRDSVPVFDRRGTQLPPTEATDANDPSIAGYMLSETEQGLNLHSRLERGTPENMNLSVHNEGGTVKRKVDAGQVRTVIDEQTGQPIPEPESKIPRVEEPGISPDRSVLPHLEQQVTTYGGQTTQRLGQIAATVLKALGIKTKAVVVDEAGLGQYLTKLEEFAKRRDAAAAGHSRTGRVEEAKTARREASDTRSLIEYLRDSGHRQYKKGGKGWIAPNQAFADARFRVPVILISGDPNTGMGRKTNQIRVLAHELGHLIQYAVLDQVVTDAANAKSATQAESQAMLDALHEAYEKSGDTNVFEEWFANQFVAYVARKHDFRGVFGDTLTDPEAAQQAADLELSAKSSDPQYKIDRRFYLRKMFEKLDQALKKMWDWIRDRYQLSDTYQDFIEAWSGVHGSKRQAPSTEYGRRFSQVMNTLATSPYLPYKDAQTGEYEFTPAQVQRARQWLQGPANRALGTRRAAQVLDTAEQVHGALRWLHSRLTQGADAYLRDNGLEWLADHFHHRPDVRKGRKIETVDAATRRLTGEWYKRANATLQRFAVKKWYDSALGNKDGRVVRNATYDAVADALIAHRADLTGLPREVQDAVRDVRKFFADLIPVLKGLGLDFSGPNGRQHYFPISYKVDELLNRKGEFIDKLINDPAFGLTPPVAEQIWRQMVETHGTGLGVGFSSRRIASWSNPQWAALRDFIEDDLTTVMTNYVQSSVKYGVINNYFGNTTRDALGNPVDNALGGLEDKLYQELRAGNITQEVYDRTLVKVLPALLGQIGADIDPRWRQFQGLAITVQNISKLGLSLLAQFPDIAGIVVRGDARSAWEGISSTIFSRKTAREVMEMGEMMGAIRDGLTEHAINDTGSDMYLGARYRNWNEAFFRATRMRWFTNVTRVMSLATGKSFLKNHAAKALAGDAKSKAALDELGVSAQSVRKWVQAGMPAPAPANTQAYGLHSDVFSALNQFVDESIIRPDSSQRPIWASDPHWAMFWHLKSFLWGFHETVLRRLWSKMLTEPSYRKLLPIAMFALSYLPAAAAGYELRRRIAWWGEPPEYYQKHGADYLWEVVQRSGALGILQLGVDMDEAEQRGRLSLLALMGPSASTFEDFLTKDFSDAFARSLPVFAQSPPLRAALQTTLDEWGIPGFDLTPQKHAALERTASGR